MVVRTGHLPLDLVIEGLTVSQLGAVIENLRGRGRCCENKKNQGYELRLHNRRYIEWTESASSERGFKKEEPCVLV